MGINAILTPADLLKGEPINPGWYEAEIDAYNEEVTKGSDTKPSDGSMNAIFSIKITTEGPAKDRVFKRYFNEKSLGFGKNLWHVLFNYDKTKGGPLSSDMFRSSVGKKLKVYVKRDDNGKWDTIVDYAPIGK